MGGTTDLPTEPDDWSKVTDVCDARVCRDNMNNAWRTYWCNGPNHWFKELIWPIYVPTPASESAGEQRGNEKDDKASGVSPAVSAADKYWAEAARQARSTAKWIATSLGAALAAIIGTAPLTPLGGKGVHWLSVPGLVIAVGLVLLGLTFFLVTSVLVPGMTFFTNLKTSKDAKFNSDRWLPDRLSVCSAQHALGRRAACERELLPIGITSLDELGHRIRLDELTLDAIAKELETIPKPDGDAAKTKKKTEKKPENWFRGLKTDPGQDKCEFWGKVKTDRGKIQQGYIDECMQWVIMADYVAVKVRADFARTIGLACGLAATALLVGGYIAIQPHESTAAANTATYAVLNVSPASPARTALGGACDAFTGIALRGAPAGKQAIYVTGGEGCKTGRVEVPKGDVGIVQPPSATLSPTAPTSPVARTSR